MQVRWYKLSYSTTMMLNEEMTNMIDDELIDITKAAKKLGVCKKTIRDWTNDGRLPCVRTLGGHRRFRTSDIERVLRGVDEDE